MPQRETLLYHLLYTHTKFKPALARKLLELAGGSVERLFFEAERFNEFPSRTRAELVALREDKERWEKAEAELKEAEDMGISLISIGDKSYPPLLKQCIDAPFLLFYQGSLGLDKIEHAVSVVGTRNATSYGRFATERIIEDLYAIVPDLVVVSGLAFGIDVTAHRTALKLGIPTIAVMAFGHKHMYPYEHRKVAAEIVENGGMLSEYTPNTGILRHQFLARNRIIAGMTQATILIESAIKGGGLTTAAIAIDYNRELVVVPGRINDRYSAGCNHLIGSSQGSIYTSASDLVTSLQWNCTGSESRQHTLATYQKLPDDPVLQIIAQHEAILFNDLLIASDMQASTLSAKLFDLELDGFIEMLPGGRYTLAFR